MPGLRPAMAAFPGRFDGDFESNRGKPWADGTGRADIVARDCAKNRIGSGSSGFIPAHGHLPLGAGHIKTGMIIKGSEVKRFKVPGFWRPDLESALQTLFQAFFEGGSSSVRASRFAAVCVGKMGRG